MSEVKRLNIIPILGLNTAVAQNDPSLLQAIGSDTYLSHDVGGQNVDYHRRRNACTKAYGYAKYADTANSEATKCLGLFELRLASKNIQCMFDNGKFFYFNNSQTPTAIEDASSTTFANNNNDLYSIIQFGDYMIFSDGGTNTPYKWTDGDANLSKLLQTGTEYKFKYLEQFQGYIIGVYSDQTYGEIDTRYSANYPTLDSTMTMAAANQIYIPNDDTATGIKRMGANACYTYCENSVHRLDYSGYTAKPFYYTTMVTTPGAAINQASIVNVGDKHFLFSPSYGFVMYDGGYQFPTGRPISESIEDIINSINLDYYQQIVGTFIPFSNEICWAVPVDSSTPDYLYFYHVFDGTWRRKNIATRYVDAWNFYSEFTWSDLLDALGSSSATWNHCAANALWATYTTKLNRFVHANTDGYVYYETGEDWDGLDIDGYRVEPMMDFGRPFIRKALRRVFFDIGNAVNKSLHLYVRSGNTEAECAADTWSSAMSLNMNSPAEPWINVNPEERGRFIQIKWGTEKDEKFIVHKITLEYIEEEDVF